MVTAGSWVRLYPAGAVVSSRYGQQKTGVILLRTGADHTSRLEEIELLSRIPGQSCASMLAILEEPEKA
jgi:hypothetical protein